MIFLNIQILLIYIYQFGEVNKLLYNLKGFFGLLDYVNTKQLNFYSDWLFFAHCTMLLVLLCTQSYVYELIVVEKLSNAHILR